jgi:hypothetical protein
MGKKKLNQLFQPGAQIYCLMQPLSSLSWVLYVGMQDDEFMMLPVNNVMKDLTSRSELFVSLSLCFAGSGAIAATITLLAPLVEGLPLS